MFRIAFQKMWHKKWMNLSLLIGCILLIGTMVSFPVYQKASFDRMLQDEFVNVLTDDGTWPILIHASIFSQQDKSGVIGKMEALVESMPDKLNLNTKESISNYILSRAEVRSDMNRMDAEGMFLRLGGMSDFEKHISMVSGECFSESGLSSDGAIEVVMSQNCMVQQGLLVGETLTFKSLKDAKGDPIRIVVKGVYKVLDPADLYWQVKAEDMGDVCFMNMETFRSCFTGDNASKYSMSSDYYMLYEYQDLRYDDVAALMSNTSYYTEESAFRSVIDDPEYMNTLNSYLRKINRIHATLIIIQVPVLVMLCAFLFMISGQMYEMEKNEISVIKSRGSSRLQIFRLYLYQSMVLTAVGTAFGIPLALSFGRILGQTRNFLEFDLSRGMKVSLTNESYIYLGVAAALCLGSLTIPAIKHSRISIVNLKQSRAIKKKALWQKLFLDFILIGISGYGYYTFNKSMTEMSVSVLEGKSLDPLLYVSSSLFIVGFGLLFLRIQPLLINIIYKLGAKFWRPAAYVSFMENIRNAGKLQLIMLFMILTISLGIYHASVARTILANALDNTEYLTGADVVIKENWPQCHDPQGNLTGYLEPDYTKYQTIDWAEKVTKVYYSDSAYVAKTKNDRQSTILMGIHTKDFGSITDLKAGLNEKPYREYLNELALAPQGVIVSSNFKKEYGYEIGDTIYFHGSAAYETSATIVDFVDYWPGFAATYTDINPSGEAYRAQRYLIVANYDMLKKKWGVQPYEIWIGLKEGCDSKTVYDFINKNDIAVRKYDNKSKEMEDTLNDPLLQGTNGVLTLGFVVTIVLCGIGYLIYWVMAIRERELMFGVLRASGFHKGELLRMLVNEQIFTGLLSIIAGILIGKFTSHLFVPILQQAYASEKQVLPMVLISRASDMYRLYGVLAAVMVISISVLTIILFRMNVTKALKLGEE